MQEKIVQLNNKRIAFLGLGIENQALLEYLVKHRIEADYHVFDLRDKQDLKSRLENLDHQKISLHKQADDNDLGSFDLIFRSPGFPLFEDSLRLAREKGAVLSSAMKFFFEVCPSKNTIGVTGSKGKGTTASLIQAMIRDADLKVFLGGNIGVAPFAFVDEIEESDWVVLELSSFQLEDFSCSPHIAVITNLSEEHLKPADPLNPNYHKSMDDYIKAKLNILKYQEKSDFAVINEKFKDKPLFFYRGKENILGKAKRIYFSKQNFPSKLIGEYNKENIGAAFAVAKLIGLKQSGIKKSIALFKGLPHRIEYVKEVSGVKYYDNSFATTPEATIADLQSFVEPIILFLGGADKGSSFRALAKEIAQRKVKYIVLLDGSASSRIKQELLAAGFPNHKIEGVDSMEKAMQIASQVAKPGDVVLLSTACASFGMFKNYKERGDLFQKEVQNL